MDSTAGTSPQASGGVSSDEQERRPEVPAGRLPRKHIVMAKAANRRVLLMVIYPVWVMVMAPVFAVLWLAGWWEDL